MPEQIIDISEFTLHGLQENRLGYLSALQKSRLAISILINCFVSCICFRLSIISICLYVSFPNDYPPLAFILWTIVGALLGTIWIVNILPLFQDLRDGTVLSATGTVHKVSTIIRFSPPKVSNGKMIRIRYQVAGMLFESSWVNSKILQDDKKFRIYYTPTSRIIVSAEPI
jgi:hypothetical protein